MHKLLVTGWVPEEILKDYRETFSITIPDHDKKNFSTQEVKDMLPEYDALFTLSSFSFKKELIDLASNLKAVANFGVGYDNIDREYCTQKGIFLINTPASVTEPTAELTIALMFAITKGIVMYDKELRDTRHCHTDTFFDRDLLLTGKTIGIIGYGRIGQAVGRKAQGLGMHVMYHNRHRKTPQEEARLGAAYGTFDEVLEKADVITCHIPYTKENHHIFNLEAFQKMKPTAYFINAARGLVMCEADLATALKEKIIRGAATDVFEFEPNVSKELAQMKNVVITPHIGSNVLESRTAMAREALDGLTAFFKGNRPENVVNKELYL